MFIMKRSLSRRTFVRGFGATLALPFLDAMVPALCASARMPAKPALRLGFIYIPQGAVMKRWTPEQEGTEFVFPPILESLAPFRDRVTVLTGLSATPANGEGGAHARASATWLNQVTPKKTEGVDVRAGRTIDQVAAARLEEATTLRSLELMIDTTSDMVGNCDGGFACTYLNTLSWRTPTTPLPMLNNPRVVFERLFGDGGTPAELRAQLHDDRSILDSVTSEVSRLQAGLGPRDRIVVTEYLDGIRETEQRIQRREARQADPELALPESPAGIPDAYDDHVKLMFDLQVLAYQADITRVITFMMSREVSGRSYPNIGVVDPHHAVSHHGNDPEKLQKLAKINTYHVQLMSYYLDKLQATADGDGSLLDHAMLLFGSCISEPNVHSYSDLPTVLVGGGAGQLQGGRHLRYPVDTPLANLLVTMMDKVGGPPLDTFGDSTGRLSEI